MWLQFYISFPFFGGIFCSEGLVQFRHLPVLQSCSESGWNALFFPYNDFILFHSNGAASFLINHLGVVMAQQAAFPRALAHAGTSGALRNSSRKRRVPVFLRNTPAGSPLVGAAAPQLLGCAAAAPRSVGEPRQPPGERCCRAPHGSCIISEALHRSPVGPRGCWLKR